MPHITPDDIRNIRAFDTLLDFLCKKLGWSIPEDVELEDIVYPWSSEDLDLRSNIYSRACNYLHTQGTVGVG